MARTPLPRALSFESISLAAASSISALVHWSGSVCIRCAPQPCCHPRSPSSQLLDGPRPAASAPDGFLADVAGRSHMILPEQWRQSFLNGACHCTWHRLCIPAIHCVKWRREKSSVFRGGGCVNIPGFAGPALLDSPLDRRSQAVTVAGPGWMPWRCQAAASGSSSACSGRVTPRCASKAGAGDVRILRCICPCLLTWMAGSRPARRWRAAVPLTH